MALFQAHTLRFKKTGGEIILALSKQKQALQTSAEKLAAQIKEICERRELTLEEVLSAGDDEARTQAYTTKLLGAGPSTRVSLPRSAVEALQADVEQLQFCGRSHALVTRKLADVQRIIENLETERTFDLTLDELTNCGF